HQIAELPVRAPLAGVAVAGQPRIHVLVQLPAHRLAAERVRHAQRRRDQKRALAGGLNVVELLGGQQKRLLRRRLRRVGRQAAAAQRAPDGGVVIVEDALQPGTVHLCRSYSLGGRCHRQTVREDDLTQWYAGWRPDRSPKAPRHGAPVTAASPSGTWS